MPSSPFSFLASFALLLSPPSVGDAGHAGHAGHAPAGADLLMPQPLEPEPAQQVRIEQRTIVRIAPRSAFSDPIVQMPQRPPVQRFHERRANRCVPLQGIAGVQVADNRLLLFMRDQRLFGASLEKACRTRDFYSGFYVERTGDGMICAGRDDVHSRAGATCAISRLRELVPDDD